MVQLIAVAAIGGVAYVAYQSFKKHMDALKREERLRSEDPKQMPELEVDPETGKYRPKK
ncbi:hypothetical protein ACFQ14_06185 [Pseudahrensia aquimaris]|uniref:Uncharacterized protein n=1 Tax=Pseudahrensia aquimaris TaxID=744461 RepID=A0ABW3FC10_9HYPH